jgi:Domain of unknown function (DUF3943)
MLKQLLRHIFCLILFVCPLTTHAKTLEHTPEVFDLHLSQSSDLGLSYSDSSEPLDASKSSTEVSQWSKYKVDLFDPKNGADGERLWSQTKLVFGLGVGVAGFIYILPENISNWEKNPDTVLYKKWAENVKAGPVWDNDSPLINYVGHPYFGGVYYQVARKSGYDQWNSFVYSALMSTFYWEYGLEAFAEIPSIQDLVVTPVGGWIYGEWAHNKEKEIKANNGLVWGSTGWGSTALFFLDPVDSIARGINGWVGREFIKSGTAMISTRATHFRGNNDQDQDYLGLDLVLVF